MPPKLTHLVWTSRLKSQSSRHTISPTRKILCIAALLALSLGATASATGADDTNGDLLAATLSQAGRELVFSVTTAAPLPLASLEPLPSARVGGDRFLCLLLRAQGHRGGRRICLGGARPRRRAGFELVNSRGGTTRTATIAVRVKRPSPNKLVLALEPAVAMLAPRRYRWRAIENRRGCRGCEATVPARGARLFRLRPVRAIGCTGGGAGLVTNGPRDRKVLALTFDDGPSEYTDDFLDVLRAKHVYATFFEVGQEVAGREDTMRRILREGSEIGNHTTHHEFYPGYPDMAATTALIRSATRFQPCLFRPPGGAVNSGVVDAAAAAGMKTVTWDVDPSDWSNPGSRAVYQRVVGAVQSGSIVVMHDGGGIRSGTLAALPSIIDTLRARGYSFATVSGLLGNRMLYRPYG